MLLLLAITSWVAFTLPIGFIHPPVVSITPTSLRVLLDRVFLHIMWETMPLSPQVSCKTWNGSRYLLQEPRYMRDKRSLPIDILPTNLFSPSDLNIDGEASGHARWAGAAGAPGAEGSGSPVEGCTVPCFIIQKIEKKIKTPLSRWILCCI